LKEQTADSEEQRAQHLQSNKPKPPFLPQAIKPPPRYANPKSRLSPLRKRLLQLLSLLLVPLFSLSSAISSMLILAEERRRER